MTIDEAIKMYTSNAEYERTHGNLQGCLEFRQLAEWLKDYKQLREQKRWISVSERLPEENGEYLVTRKSPVYEYVDIVKKTNIFCSGDIASDIIAWMPLPESYKGE